MDTLMNVSRLTPDVLFTCVETMMSEVGFTEIKRDKFFVIGSESKDTVVLQGDDSKRTMLDLTDKVTDDTYICVWVLF